MGREAVHRSWAEALFELSKEAGKVTDMEAELAAVAQLYDEMPEWSVFAITPRIRVEAKQQLIDKAFKGKVDDLLLNTMKLAASRRRLRELPGISRAFTALVDEAEGRERVRVTSAVALDDDSRESIKAAVGERLNKTVILEESVDERLIGGLVIEYGDVRIDGSVRNRLRNFLRAAKERVRAGTSQAAS